MLITCPNCGHPKNKDDSAFCVECGGQLKPAVGQAGSSDDNSTSGGLNMAEGARLTALEVHAGNKQEIETAGGDVHVQGSGSTGLEEKSSALNMGEGAKVTAAEIRVGNTQNIQTDGGAVHLHDHTADADKLLKCAISGREVRRVEGLSCPECNRWVCNDVFLTPKNRCTKCDEDAERKFRILLDEVYEDGIVEAEERRALKQKAAALFIDEGKALDLEKPYRIKTAPPLGGMQKIQLEEAKRLLYREMDAFSSWDSLESVFDARGKDDDAVSEEIRRLYLLVQMELNPKLALTFTDETLQSFDDPQSYYMQMEYYERRGDVRGMQRTIGLAEGRLPDHACVQGGVMKHCLDQYSQNRADTYLKAAEEAYSKITSGADEPIVNALRAYYLYRRNSDKEAFVAEEEKTQSDVEAFYIRKLKNELNAGRLELEINGTAYSCHHGDILGRKGEVAKAHLGAIGEVHGEHAEVFCCFGQWHIRALPATRNPTYVDDILVEPGRHEKLTGEHRLRLSSKFEGKLRVVPVNPNDRI